MKKYKLIFLGVLSIIFLLVISNYQAYFYTQNFALNVATQKFESFCSRKGLDKTSFLKPVKTDVNALWAYNWKSKSDGDFQVEVRLCSDGYPELYYMDEGGL